jgi:hypothetical protein
MSGASRPRVLRFPAVRFRAKIILGFVVVLAISVASLGIAYLGFEHIASAVASYRNSVSEADLARNIDRELISYRALAKYYVATGKDDDAKAALAAEASLKDAIDRSLNDTGKASRREGLDRLAAEFKNFAATFADILKVKRDSALVTQNQLTRDVQSVAQGTREAASNIVEVNRGATETGSASGEVLNSAKALSSESTRLKAELDRFMTNIRAA